MARLVCKLAFLAFAIGIFGCGVLEYRRSSHELRIVRQLEGKGGYVLRPAKSVDEFINTAENYLGKPVLIELVNSRLARATGDLLGVRIERVIFESDDASAFVDILRQSDGVKTIAFSGDRTGKSKLPFHLIEGIDDSVVQIIEFDRYAIGSQEMAELCKTIDVPCVALVACTFPSESLKNLRQIRSLKTVVIHMCNLTGDPGSINDSVSALQAAGIEIIYE
ncbi:MAG: hypothetical protein WD468_11170 [Pirellulales bacterium]